MQRVYNFPFFSFLFVFVPVLHIPIIFMQAAKAQWSLDEKVGSSADTRVRRVTGRGVCVCDCISIVCFVFTVCNTVCIRKLICFMDL